MAVDARRRLRGKPGGLITGDVSSRYFLCSLFPIPAGGTATARIDLTPTRAGTLTNTVQDFFGQQVQTTVTVLPTGGTPIALQSDQGATVPYVVRPGDTLNEIAQRFGTSVEGIARASGIDNPHLIFAGQSLSIPT